MKNKYFGNILDEDFGEHIRNTGNSTEFYKASDKFSARTLNRPIRANYEDLENIYETIQNICKTLYGQKENGILPDVYEEMDTEALITGHFFNEVETFIRIPTGAFFAKLDDEQAKYYKTSYEESNQYSRDFYIDNDRNAAIIFNRPNIELFERQLAEHFNIDLNDQDENIRLYCESYTEKTQETNPTTESEHYIDIANKCSRKQKIRYYLHFDTTKYDYINKENGKGTVITSVVNSGRIPLNSKNYCNNVFGIVEQVKNTYGNYLTQKDSEFGLEELISVDRTWPDGEYIIFFNPNTKEAVNSEQVNYSDSGRFGIVALNNVNSIFGTNENCKIIKLYKVQLNFVEDTKGSFRRCEIDRNNIVSYLSKIDRTTLDIKNINLTNALNNLVIERAKYNNIGNINIGEAHVKQDENLGDRNISIGLRNLGYPEINGIEQDPTLDSQRYKTNIGYDNISIGANAMKRTTVTENRMAEKNIAIGTNALINIGNGRKNIEIGTGNGYIKSKEGNINIGDNLTAYYNEVELGDYNIILGDKNAYKSLKINNKNIIIGNENNNDNNQLSIDDENIIIGKNKLNTIGSKNIVIGNNSVALNSGDNNTFIGLNNTSGSKGDDNYVIGSNNCNGALGNSNVVIGHSNIDTDTEAENNYIIGKENNSNSSNSFIFGSENTLIETESETEAEAKTGNNYVVGKANSITNSNNIVAGFENTVSNTNNKIYGFKNNITSNDNLILGDENTSSEEKNNIFGNNNNSTGKSNIIISTGKEVAKNNNIVIGCSNETVGNIDGDNQVIIGPIGGTTYIENGLEITEEKPTASAIKIDGKNGDIQHYFKTTEFIGKTTNFEGNVIVKTGSLQANKYISQSLNGSDMYVNTDDNHTTGIPVSGSLYTSTLPETPKNSVTNYKSFVGSLELNDNSKAFDFISIRENNGKGAIYGESATQGSIIFTDRKSGRLYSSVQKNGKWDEDRQYIDTTGGQTINGKITFGNGIEIPERSEETTNTKIFNGLEVRGNVLIKQKSNVAENTLTIESPTTIKKNFNIATGDASLSVNANETNIKNKKINLTTPNLYIENTNSSNNHLCSLKMGDGAYKKEQEKITADGKKVTEIVEMANGAYLESSEKIILEAAETRVNASNKVSINSQNNTYIDAQNDTRIGAKNNINFDTTSGDIILSANQNTSITSGETINIKSVTTEIQEENYGINLEAADILLKAIEGIAFMSNETLVASFYSNGNGNDNVATFRGGVTATDFTATSARKYKKNIVPTVHKAVDEINKIDIVDFNFKTDKNNKEPKIGFIADDTDEIFSTKSKDKMDIYNCVGMLLKAVQELSAENKELKDRISKLEGK